MKITTIASALSTALSTALAMTIPACQKKGPAEELGEKIDDFVKDLKESVEKDGAAEKFGAPEIVRMLIPRDRPDSRASNDGGTRLAKIALVDIAFHSS